MGQFDEFKAKKKELEDMLSSFGQDMLKEEFKKWFDDFPELKAFSWTQYTPYFNDGEPCVFQISSESFVFTEDELNSLNAGKLEWYDYDYYSIEDKNLKDKAREIESKLNELEDVLESVFGDGYRIVVTREKIEVEEYSHE